MKHIDYSIEFCHIYLNETFSHEHQHSIDVVKGVIAELPAGATHSLNVLIDDYNATEEVLDIEDLKARLRQAGVKPDYLAYEAQLAPYADTLLSEMSNGKLKRSYEQYIRDKETIPCSFMIAIWYLLRLGAIPLRSNARVYEKNGGHTKPFVADHLTSVLPERFSGVETKALAIISKTKFAALKKQIRHVYYDGPEGQVQSYAD
ncbi:MAG TPA: hypothetical protein VMR75_00655 [Candidatus Saccharimonadales bacterium]|nr:hypothetical protein [Candidatus Saccharimonadales bacterium]